ncbi:MAG: hypothetical protein JW807_10330 [Spirochaetes bacterium]|nr:hypothetical protein [Spirochaetota bacterium]
MELLVITGAILIILSILTGWLIVARRYLAMGPVVRLIKDDAKLVKCHMEYPLMAVILFAFYGISANLPYLLVAAACVGAFTNPSLQLVRAVRPDIDTRPMSAFGVFSTLSFLVTSIGLGGLSLVVIYNLVR